MTEPTPTTADPAVRTVLRRGWQQARITSIVVQTPSVKTFTLTLPQWTAHLPGQHYVVRLTAPDGYRAQRSYSVASAPEHPGTVDLAVERLPDGEVSGYLHDGLAVGDALEVRGPLGGWFVWDGASPALLVGGGSGVVPLVSMLRSRRARRRQGAVDVPMHLVVSARSPADLLFADELVDDPDVTVVFTRSVPEGWPRPAGRLEAADLAPWVAALGAGDARRATCFVCGSAGFAGAAERLLEAAGADPAGLRAERFGPG